MSEQNPKAFEILSSPDGIRLECLGVLLSPNLRAQTQYSHDISKLSSLGQYAQEGYTLPNLSIETIIDSDSPLPLYMGQLRLHDLLILEPETGPSLVAIVEKIERDHPILVLVISDTPGHPYGAARVKVDSPISLGPLPNNNSLKAILPDGPINITKITQLRQLPPSSSRRATGLPHSEEAYSPVNR